MPPAVTLEGGRVRLEPLSLSHVGALVRAASQARDTFAFTMVPADHAAMTRYVQAALADQRTGWALPFAIYDLRSQAVVGSTRFLDLDYWSWPPAWPPGRTTPRPDAIPTVAEIGSTWLAPCSTRFLDLDYWSWPPAWPPGRTTPQPDATPTVAEIGSTWLASSVQRTGCNTESKLLMLGHAFDTWGVLRVTLKTDARNARSRRAIERIGGRFEGIRRAHARAVDGSVRDTAYYSIVAAEWPAVRAALAARMRALPR